MYQIDDSVIQEVIPTNRKVTESFLKISQVVPFNLAYIPYNFSLKVNKSFWNKREKMIFTTATFTINIYCMVDISLNVIRKNYK